MFSFMPRWDPIAHDSGMFELARELRRDDEESNADAAARRVHENFLICGDRAYVRGGIPVYVHGWHQSLRRNVFGVANSGADRSIEPAIATSFTHRSQEWRTTFESADIWLPTDRAAVLSASGDEADRVPAIEVLSAERIVDVLFETRLDAIFAGALEMFESSSGTWKPKLAKAYREMLAPGIEVVAGSELNRRRFAALSELVGTSTPRHMDRLALNFYDMTLRHGLDLPLFDFSVFGPADGLAPEDDAALANLA